MSRMLNMTAVSSPWESGILLWSPRAAGSQQRTWGALVLPSHPLTDVLQGILLTTSRGPGEAVLAAARRSERTEPKTNLTTPVTTTQQPAGFPKGWGSVDFPPPLAGKIWDVSLQENKQVMLLYRDTPGFYKPTMYLVTSRNELIDCVPRFFLTVKYFIHLLLFFCLTSQVTVQCDQNQILNLVTAGGHLPLWAWFQEQSFSISSQRINCSRALEKFPVKKFPFTPLYPFGKNQDSVLKYFCHLLTEYWISHPPYWCD